MLTFEEWRHTYADVFATDDAARAAWTAASNKGYSAGVQDTRELLAAHSAGRSLPLSKEQKAALDLAVLNLKTHGDDQLLSAVTPLIEYYKSTAHSAGAKGLPNEERKQIDNALDMLLCAMRAANWEGDAAYSAGEKARALLAKGE